MNFLPRYFPIVLFVFAFGEMQGQSYIKGKIIDSTQAPVPFITLGLIQQSDSAIYKGTITDEKGNYLFEDLKPGNYLIKVSQIGFEDKYSSPVQIDSLSKIDFPPLQLVSNSISMNAVSISAIKDPIEFENGNITMNIEGSPLAIGNSAYELLSRLPGVMVINDVITIQGKAGAKIYIDDREQQMSGAQLINFLKTLNASSIEKITVITNPPARYDAAGTAGIINIKTKKIKITGFSGGLSYDFSQGFYYTNNTGFSLNYKGKNFALFSSVNAYQGLLNNVSTFDKTIHANGESTQFNQSGSELDKAYYGSINLGADWYINKKNILGAKMQIAPGYAERTLTGHTNISDTSSGYDQLGFTRIIRNDWNTVNYNINAEHLFDTLGTRLRFSADYYSSYDNYKGSYRNLFSANGNASLPAQNFKSDNKLGLNILVGKLDFEKTFSETLNMEAGLKASHQRIGSDFILQNQNNQNGEYSTDSAFTNNFSYEELISAAYFNLGKKFKKVNLQIGLRGENTAITIESEAGNIKYTRQYFNLFPVLSIDYNRSAKHKFSFAYNTRIGRPGYNSFNPYRSFDNILNSSEGNPYLLPDYSHSFNISYISNHKIYHSLYFGRSKNSIQGFTAQNDSTRETIQQLSNLSSFEFMRYSFFIRQNIQNWWVMTFNCGAYYIAYGGKVNGQDFSISAVPYYGFVNNQFMLPKDFKAELNAYYWSPWVGGAGVFKARYGVSMAIKKSMFDNKFNVSIALNDIFFSETLSSTASFQNQSWTQFNSNDSRRINVSLSYNFGKVKAEQRQEEGSDEKSRLGR